MEHFISVHLATYDRNFYLPCCAGKEAFYEKCGGKVTTVGEGGEEREQESGFYLSPNIFILNNYASGTLGDCHLEHEGTK